MHNFSECQACIFTLWKGKVSHNITHGKNILKYWNETHGMKELGSIINSVRFSSFNPDCIEHNAALEIKWGFSIPAGSRKMTDEKIAFFMGKIRLTAFLIASCCMNSIADLPIRWRQELCWLRLNKGNQWNGRKEDSKIDILWWQLPLISQLHISFVTGLTCLLGCNVKMLFEAE